MYISINSFALFCFCRYVDDWGCRIYTTKIQLDHLLIFVFWFSPLFRLSLSGGHDTRPSRSAISRALVFMEVPSIPLYRFLLSCFKKKDDFCSMYCLFEKETLEWQEAYLYPFYLIINSSVGLCPCKWMDRSRHLLGPFSCPSKCLDQKCRDIRVTLPMSLKYLHIFREIAQ